MNRKIGMVVLLLLAVVLVFPGCSSEPSAPSPTAPSVSPVPGATEVPAEKVTLKIGSLPRIFDLIAYAAERDGIFEKHNLDVEIVSFRSTVEMNNALLVGELDGSIQGTFEAVNLNKEGENAKLVGHNFMPRMFEVVASQSSGITSADQLKGKEVATGTGTIMEYAMDELLRAQGMAGKDVNYVNVPNIALRVEMLNQGKVPVAVLTSPTSDLAVMNGARIILDDAEQLLGGPGLIFSIGALNSKSDGIDRFVKAWQETVDLINASPREYHSLLIDVARVPEQVASSLAVPVFPKLRLPEEVELKSITDWMIEKGLMIEPVPYDRVVETKYLD